MRHSFAVIKNFNDYRFHLRELPCVLKLRLAKGVRSRGRVATRTTTICRCVRPDASAAQVRRLVEALAPFFAQPMIGWYLVRRYEAVEGARVPLVALRPAPPVAAPMVPMIRAALTLAIVARRARAALFFGRGPVMRVMRR